MQLLKPSTAALILIAALAAQPAMADKAVASIAAPVLPLAASGMISASEFPGAISPDGENENRRRFEQRQQEHRVMKRRIMEFAMPAMTFAP